MRKGAGASWDLAKQTDGTSTYEAAKLSVLQDIRDELMRLNRLLHCSNFVTIPNVLREIRANTKRKRRKKIKP